MGFFPVTQLQAPALPSQPSPRDQLLAQMKDVITPEPVGLWPPAPGWWILGLTMCVLVVAAVYSVTRHRRLNRYRKSALRELHSLTHRASKNNDNEYTAALNTLLKKTAFSAYPGCRDDLAGLYGRQWQRFLDAVLKKPFPNTLPQHWTDAIYQAAGKTGTSNSKIARKPLAEYTEFWLKHHRALTSDQLRAVLRETRTTPAPSIASANDTHPGAAHHV